MVKYIFDVYKEEFKRDRSTDPKILAKVKLACKDLKEALSGVQNYEFSSDALSTDEESFEKMISRELFEEICKPVFDRIIKPLDQALQ